MADNAGATRQQRIASDRVFTVIAEMLAAGTLTKAEALGAHQALRVGLGRQRGLFADTSPRWDALRRLPHGEVILERARAEERVR